MTLLIIAGLECNGFAGAVKDLNVAHQYGLQPQLVLTLLTAQTNDRLVAAHAVNPTLIQRQLAALEIAPKVVKIGVVPTVDIAQAIANWLQSLAIKPFVVVDPVMTSSSDHRAFTSEPLLNIITPLLPSISLLTPNLNELPALLQQPRPASANISTDELAALFYQQQTRFTGELLVKGGHDTEGPNHQLTDKLYRRAQHLVGPVAQWQQTRQPAKLRGTGCSLSTTISCARHQGYSVLDAITLASARLQKSFQQAMLKSRALTTMAADLSSPNGWSTDIHHCPVVANDVDLAIGKHRYDELIFKNGLYPIVDSADWVAQLANSNITTIQLRLKNKSTEQLRIEIKQAVELARQYNLQLFINDHWRLAIELGAYGVHLGQEDLADADLQAIANAGLRLGISTHGDFELLRAYQLRPSYIAVGAIFPTQTKDMAGQIQGLERLKRYTQLITDIPIVAIGGIHDSNIHEVLAQQPDMVAVVSAVTKADNPEQSCRQLDTRCRQATLKQQVSRGTIISPAEKALSLER